MNPNDERVEFCVELAADETRKFQLRLNQVTVEKIRRLGGLPNHQSFVLQQIKPEPKETHHKANESGTFDLEFKGGDEFQVILTKPEKEEEKREEVVDITKEISSMLKENKKSQPMQIKGRNVLLICVGEKIFAIDAACYHAGGPLETGDIEDFHGRKCVFCPWHNYKIDIETGEGLYLSAPDGCLKSKGKKQRTHQIKVGDEKYFISVLINPEEKMESDRFAFLDLWM
eukprot:TRINITY_DN4187_c0_g1_i3.p1 TRINITY_DN4187_c0_g1~~TRINITY_DN4187_c0_g1_i3.p1  ORF type:complete len:239 (+),score=83.97 TRINITY_DN4187_c0_g1_i3:32-718(+)